MDATSGTTTTSFALSASPDAYGFHYGTARRGEEFIIVNVLPPRSHWRGERELGGFEPDARAWKIYFDGAQVARVVRQSDVASSITRALDAPRRRRGGLRRIVDYMFSR